MISVFNHINNQGVEGSTYFQPVEVGSWVRLIQTKWGIIYKPKRGLKDIELWAVEYA